MGHSDLMEVGKMRLHIEGPMRRGCWRSRRAGQGLWGCGCHLVSFTLFSFSLETSSIKPFMAPCTNLP